MQIYGPSQVHGPQTLSGPHATRTPAKANPSASAAIGDQLDISEASQLLSQAHDIPDIREDLVARVRSEIANGNYDTPERMDVALERLLDELV